MHRFYLYYTSPLPLNILELSRFEVWKRDSSGWSDLTDLRCGPKHRTLRAHQADLIVRVPEVSIFFPAAPFFPEIVKARWLRPGRVEQRIDDLDQRLRVLGDMFLEERPVEELRRAMENIFPQHRFFQENNVVKYPLMVGGSKEAV